MKTKLRFTTLGVGATVLLSGCSGLVSGNFNNPYTDRVNQLESNVSAIITDCGGSRYFPPQVTIRNNNDELVDFSVYIGFFDSEGTLVDEASASAKIPANKQAKTEAYRGSDTNWATCEIMDTLLLPDQ